MLNNEFIEIPPPIQPLPVKRVWGPWPTIGYSAVIMVGFFIAQFLAIIISLIAITVSQGISFEPGSYDGITRFIEDALYNYMGLIQSLATIFSGIIGLLLIWVFIKVKKGADVKEYLGLNRMSGRAVWLSMGVIIAFIGLMTLVQTVTGIGSGDEITYDIYSTSVWPPLFWIAVVIFAPLFEEALFRGFLFEGLRQSRLGVLGAVAITSITWASLHIQYNLFGIVYIFLLGIVIGLIRWKTKSIWSALIMHALVNLIATIGVAVTA
jgi:hypothetical protein